MPRRNLLIAIAFCGGALAGLAAGKIAPPEALAQASGQGSAQSGQASGGEAEALQVRVAKLESQLRTLQEQFAKHVHTFTMQKMESTPILNCGAYGEPCTNATRYREIVVLTEPSVGASATTVSTSPPKF